MGKKVKIFEFEVSNYATNASNSDMKLASFRDASERLVTTDIMEDMINYFLRGKNLLEIEVTPVTTYRHNNCKNDTVMLVYTITYTEKERV